MNINPNNSTNVTYRTKDSVVEGNEFTDFNKNNIKWDWLISFQKLINCYYLVILKNRWNF